MITNLPLLFTNGNPTALSEITAEELEKFITFMVTCSWGHDTAKSIRRPPWWPKDVAFSHPFVRPNEVPVDWELRLKELVKKCYDYHKSNFLLVFSAQLARYPRHRLKYVDNCDGTTSLYYMPSGRLLVTFRNENTYYDRSDEIDSDIEEVPLRSTDIYLCDSCDSHFDNEDALRAHERVCNQENAPPASCNGGLPEFLAALKLQPVGEIKESKIPQTLNGTGSKPRNVRSVTNIDRGPPYPFSSLAYMRNLKFSSQRDTSYSRERIERYCCTPFPVSKNVGSKSRNQQFPVKYRRPMEYLNRHYTFPNQRKKRILDLKAQLLLLKCKPVSVDIEKMSEKRMQEYIDNLKLEAQKRAEKDVIYVDGLDCEQTTLGDMCDPLRRLDLECEVIDLCSDDEGGSSNENYDPRAGVACVMRGGAVLRRAPAVTPRQLPAEPCGALLQPHPVILIAHSLNHLQTISLE